MSLPPLLTLSYIWNKLFISFLIEKSWNVGKKTLFFHISKLLPRAPAKSNYEHRAGTLQTVNQEPLINLTNSRFHDYTIEQVVGYSGTKVESKEECCIHREQQTIDRATVRTNKKLRRFVAVLTVVCLPSDNFINDCLLFTGSAPEVDTSSFNALMPHQVCKQRYVVELFEKVLGIAMSE